MWLKRQRESNVRSQIVPDENQKGGTDRAGFDNRHEYSLFQAPALPERITRLMRHSSMPPRCLSRIVTIWQRPATVHFVKTEIFTHF
jgi:hypothetical protein